MHKIKNINNKKLLTSPGDNSVVEKLRNVHAI
jgi:hypothetical protein